MSKSTPLIEVTLKGSSFDRGLKHGSEFSVEICPRVERLWAIAQQHLGRIMPLIDETAAMIEKLQPEFNREMEGISKGTGIPFEQIFLFNNRDLMGFVEADFCTHMCMNDGTSTVVGMNKDGPVIFRDKYFIKKVYPSSGLAFIGFGHVGRIWGYGLNEAGVCAAGTAATPAGATEVTSAVGLYLIPPLILSTCSDIDQAVDLIMSIPKLSGGGNILIAEQTGNSVVVEISPAKRFVRKAQNGVIYSSNHYASGQIEHNDTPERLSESHARFAELGNMFGNGNGNAVDKVQKALKHHTKFGSICRHNVLGFNTILSYYAVLEKRQFFVANGFPCENHYHCYEL